MIRALAAAVLALTLLAGCGTAIPPHCYPADHGHACAEPHPGGTT